MAPPGDKGAESSPNANTTARSRTEVLSQFRKEVAEGNAFRYLFWDANPKGFPLNHPSPQNVRKSSTQHPKCNLCPSDASNGMFKGNRYVRKKGQARKDAIRF